MDLAERLGYRRTTDFRKLVKRHRATIKEFGPLRQCVAMVAIGSGAKRRVTQYHLNREQAIYLTTQAGTPRARAMTVYIVKVFDRYLEGKFSDGCSRSVGVPPGNSDHGLLGRRVAWASMVIPMCLRQSPNSLYCPLLSKGITRGPSNLKQL